MFYTFALLLMLAGLLSSCAYFGIGLHEKILLSKIPRKERPKWIPVTKFQTNLGHMAMLGGLGYLTAFLVARRMEGGVETPVLLVSIFFFLEGLKRFARAARVPIVKEHDHQSRQ